MTTRPPAEQRRPWASAAASIVAVVALVVVALVGVFGPPATAAHPPGPENRVAVIDLAGGQRVGANDLVLPGQRRPRAPTYDGCATGSCVAAETEGGLVAVEGDSSIGAMRRLEFEASPKHPDLAPQIGQDALDNSLSISENTTRRVGVDYNADRFLVFDETYPGEGVFHGHYRDWSDLTQQMQSVLRRAGMASGRGAVL